MFNGALEPGKMLIGNDTITIYMAFAVFAKKMVFRIPQPAGVAARYFHRNADDRLLQPVVLLSH